MFRQSLTNPSKGLTLATEVAPEILISQNPLLPGDKKFLDELIAGTGADLRKAYTVENMGDRFDNVPEDVEIEQYTDTHFLHNDVEAIRRYIQEVQLLGIKNMPWKDHRALIDANRRVSRGVTEDRDVMDQSATEDYGCWNEFPRQGELLLPKGPKWDFRFGEIQKDLPTLGGGIITRRQVIEALMRKYWETTLRPMSPREYAIAQAICDRKGHLMDSCGMADPNHKEVVLRREDDPNKIIGHDGKIYSADSMRYGKRVAVRFYGSHPDQCDRFSDGRNGMEQGALTPSETTLCFRPVVIGSINHASN